MAEKNGTSKGSSRSGSAKSSASSQKNANTNTAKSATQSGGDSGGGDTTAEETVPARVAQRQKRYMLAPRSAPGQVQPMAVSVLSNAVENMPDVKIVKRLKPRGFSAQSLGGGGTEVIVAEMPETKGKALCTSAPPNVVVEPDARLRNYETVDAMELMRASIESTVKPMNGSISVPVRINVVGEGGKPLANAAVTAYGEAFPAQGKTDQHGQVVLELFGGTIDSVQAIYVKPEKNHWERFVSKPALSTRGFNTIALDPLGAMFDGFPKRGVLGWGQHIMGLGQLGPQLTGEGVRVAVIDSGCDVSHRQLSHAKGADLTTDDNTGDGWTNDEIHHGSHCAGIIAARGFDQGGIRGFAPGAELFAYKVFPGGRFSDLIEALDKCIEDEIDVANLSLGSGQPSELVSQKIAEAAQAGVACIVAAGNSANEVQFPGVLPQVLTVSAIGQTGMFPVDSYHAQTVLKDVMGQENTFGAKFSCFGPQIGVCGPGVAIISTVPGGYAAWDGTSMATPHITGLATLVLAHHPLFAGNKERTPERVQALFDVLRSASLPVIADVLRAGVGLPLAPLALAAAQQSQPAQASQQQGEAAGVPVQAPPQGAPAFTQGAFPGQGASGIPAAAMVARGGIGGMMPPPPGMVGGIAANNPLVAAQLRQLRAAGMI
ncbi:S8 family serine peptidase [Erythrobacter sp. THAF29]|uniref:S8 family serine peptidase n=1 Tax=Erythrobacter sp. THAF29 TaxID=2587851 RepID=UPI001268C947|nr:S8 family serine peptidase [Erythrobacter sp. THAF29]QFT76056.1 Subtilisin [Erythrobacter sp. THAF29]